jgi:hypothetical protein
VIGEPAAGTTLYALSATLPGAPQQLVLPKAEGTALRIAPANPLSAAAGKLPITLTATAPGAYRFSAGQVFYRLVGDIAADGGG